MHPPPSRRPTSTDARPADAPRVARVDLPCQPQACCTARRTARLLLATWDVADDDRVHDVLVVVSELVGNAVRHGEVRLTLDLRLDPAGLLIAVSDGGAGLPQQRTGADDAEGGRGLAIVDALARDWGCEQLADGTRVWARLEPFPPTGP